MPPKPVEIYQGSDWLTYRWSVAQAFDTLDRIRDLCLQMPVAAGSTAPPSGVQMTYDIPVEDIADMYGYIVELCDDLSSELDAVHADLANYLYSHTPQLWMAFEMRLHLRDLRLRALKDAESGEASISPPDTILLAVTRIKALIKQIDQ